MEDGDYKRAKLILVFILIISLTAQIILYNSINKVEDVTARVVTSGTVRICIGQVPMINFSNCNNSVLQNEYYSCILSISNNVSNVTYASEFTYLNRYFNDSEEPLFIVSNEGEFNFTGDNNDVGNFTIKFTAINGGACGGAQKSNLFDINIINVNDAPIFEGNLDNLTLTTNQKFYGFYLSDYFSDPDLDDLLYDITGNNQIEISSGAFYFNQNPNPANNQVVFESETCGFSETVYFTAIDEYNATKNSNSMGITVNCDNENEETPSLGGAGGGGGSGSDSGVQDTYKPLNPKFSHFKHEDCTENWNCTIWSECYINGTMNRICYDLAKCGTNKYEPQLVKNCTYGGNCNDGIRNCHDGSCEDNIDCGGPCMPCKLVEIPLAQLQKLNDNIWIYLLGGAGLILIILGGYFHKTIMGLVYGALGLAFLKRKEKQILISVKNKTNILKKLKTLEQKINKKELPFLIASYGKVLKSYLICACGNNLSRELTIEELKIKLNKKNEGLIHPLYNKILSKLIRKEIKALFIAIYGQYEFIESNKYVN
ncbi:MAG: hypothetical protein KAQ83_00725, partial [Nanoarchaeota archaeon]|nr:hypothetical protein [Nanoarchaeota archaeon]